MTTSFEGFDNAVKRQIVVEITFGDILEHLKQVRMKYLNFRPITGEMSVPMTS